MPSYMVNPQIKVVVDSTEIQCEDAKITRLENGFDTATFTIADRIDLEGSKYYPTVITDGKPIECYLKAALDADWVLVFKGIIRFLHMPISEAGEFLKLNCDGAGYGFAETVCGEEYGGQSRNPTIYSIGAILTNSGKGIIPKHVNNILGSDTESGYEYSPVVESISGTLQYVYFPYKPCNKAIADLCDLLQAIKGTTAGPHWIVTPSDKFLLATIGAHPSAVENEGWTTWFKKGATENESRNLSTLTQGVDFKEFDFQPLAPEANYILYYGAWRRPGSGDRWTEASSGLWEQFFDDCVISNDSTNKVVGAQSIRCTKTVGAGDADMYYPKTADASWDFKVFTEFNTPTLNFYLRKSEGIAGNITIILQTTDLGSFSKTLNVPDADKWHHFALPVGPDYNTSDEFQGFTWDETGEPSWGDIDFIRFTISNVSVDSYLCVDGLHFGGAAVCRVAKNLTKIAGADKLKTKVIVDNVGKDDSLDAVDDSGTIARLAKAELLRCQNRITVGYVVTPCLKDLLPGQFVHIRAKQNVAGDFNIERDFRVTKIIHDISDRGFFTISYLTDDLANSYPRMAYDEMNKIMAAIRPEYQDRQAANIKAGTVDIRITKLETNYPS